MVLARMMSARNGQCRLSILMHIYVPVNAVCSAWTFCSRSRPFARTCQWAITNMNMVLYQNHVHVIDNDYYKLNIRTIY